MRNLYLLFFLTILNPNAIRLSAQDTYQLAPPLMQYSSVFFEKQTTIVLRFAQAGAQIRYTLNGAEPSEKDALYKGPVTIRGRRQVTLKARAFAKGFLPSESATATFVRRGLPITAITHTPPHEAYGGSGPRTLADGKGGLPGHGAKTWMGFQQDTFRAECALARRHAPSQILFHTLNNQGAWIFLPQKIEVWGYDRAQNKEIWMGEAQWPADQKDNQSAYRILSIPIQKPFSTDKILVKAYAMKAIPDWHDGKGSKPWLFVDEIGIY